ncbi:serine/threonine-protein phosphatase 6 regulatory subunit 3-like isoform X2 [Panicum miliaceum]|uniref:Serine/threonine-protein phosphatase 6 regulatory subunit 3-like isoform X2 n=1 Tax=Panicum miliaceum TaxID=4540 RepID=A0A3L6R2N2_PANMI|nr:serine/threonine-protein phosphatase 6 regulatory subunit 3-like isoform X2 [Panicum miliaceum]
MFWRMTGLSAASPVSSSSSSLPAASLSIVKCDMKSPLHRALLQSQTGFVCLRDKAQVEQLLRYIVEEVPEDSEKKRSFKFPFIACEIFTCEIDVILRTLVEDEELMDLLFSFVKPDHPHSTLLSGYFSKVAICLMLRKTAQLMNYVQGHPEIVVQLVDLIGITSIMEVLIRLIGADENIYSNYGDTMQWLENTDVLEMIADKFSSSDSPEVHANAAEILCAVTRCAPPSLATKICSPSFVGRLFHHALEESRPKSVLVHSLSVCISLLDPKRLASASYQAFRSNLSHGALVTASPETVDGMLESLGNLLKLLDTSSAENVLPTTYGYLRPPLGKHRLKIVEFISVLLTIGSETAEKELIRQSAIKRSIDLFFEYPYNNFLHHHVENIIVSCLEGKRTELVEHVLNECDIVGKILVAERLSSLSTESNGPTVPSEEKAPPRIGNVGHMTRIANKLIQLGNSNSRIQAHLQENTEWVEWQTNVLVKRNEVENVYHWACGRPTSLHDRGRDSDDDDFRDRDYDVAALANNLSQAFRYGIYSNDDIEEAQGSLERDDEDVYFDDESAEVVISSLRLGDDQEGSLFTNSNWFTFDGERGINDRLSGSVPSSSSNSEETSLETEEADDGKVIGTEDEMETVCLGNGSTEEAKDVAECTEQPNCSTADEPLQNTEGIEQHSDVLNGDTEVGTDEVASAVAESSATSIDIVAEKTVDEPLVAERTIGESAASSDVDNFVYETSPGVNGNEPADSEVSSEQVSHDTDVQQPVKEVAGEDVDETKTDAVKASD